MKTRGPNPNPTAQAQSKRCLPLSTKTQNVIENVSILASILGAFLEPFPQKWPEGSRAIPQSANKTPNRHNPVPPNKLQTPTSRGRVLAEGDVDPAAGSRDEPTRLHVEAPVAERKQGFEVQVTSALFLYTINWVPPLPPTRNDLVT